jgi:glutaredoxin
MTHIKLITVPLCPKCKIMRKRLQRIQENRPDVTVEEVGLQSYIDEALKKRILDAPIILVNDKTYSGVVDEETLLSSL